jgi:hypothetical protein
MAPVTTRTFADFFNKYRRDRESEMARLSITVTDFKPLARNTLVGFATIHIPEMRLTLRDVAIHQKGNERWAQLPAKPQIDREGVAIRKDGKIQYSTILEFDDRTVRDAFSGAVIAALLEHEPNAFGRAA